MVVTPGSAGLVLVDGVRFLDERTAVFDAMLEGWSRQQASRRLTASTVDARIRLIRRFQHFTGEYPWDWSPQDVEDFTVSLNSNGRRLGTGTLRGYHLTMRQFCDYLTDRRYDWPEECDQRFSAVPMQICHESNTVAHVNEYEGRPGRRPLTYDEVQTLFDYCDDRVERIVRARRKGALAALRDSQMIKTTYAFGLRRREVVRLDVADLRPNPQVREWGRYGSLHVRYGKAVKGGPPRRRTVLAVPEFDWAIDGMRQWAEQARPRLEPRAHPALWVTERNSRVSVRYLDTRFAEIGNLRPVRARVRQPPEQ